MVGTESYLETIYGKRTDFEDFESLPAEEVEVDKEALRIAFNTEIGLLNSSFLWSALHQRYELTEEDRRLLEEEKLAPREGQTSGVQIIRFEEREGSMPNSSPHILLQQNIIEIGLHA